MDRDNIPAKEDANQQLPTFPYKVWDTQTNDAPSCIKQCQLYGFNAAGLEYASQCCMYTTPSPKLVADITQSAEIFKTSLLLLHQQRQQTQMMFNNTRAVQHPSRILTRNAMQHVQETPTTGAAPETSSLTTPLPRAQ